MNIAVDFLAQQPRERAELFFRRGTYTLDSKVSSRRTGEQMSEQNTRCSVLRTTSFSVLFYSSPSSQVDSPVFTLKNIKPINNGRLIIAGAGVP